MTYGKSRDTIKLITYYKFMGAEKIERKERLREINKRYNTQFRSIVLRIPNDQYPKLKSKALEQKITVTELVRNAVFCEFGLSE